MKKRFLWIIPPLFATLLIAGLFLVGRVSGASSRFPRLFFPLVWNSTTLSGVVRDADGPVAGAVVRVQATTNATRSDGNGRFTLAGLSTGEAVSLTAWAPGYYIAGGEDQVPGKGEVVITLLPLLEQDNPDYVWLSANEKAGLEGNCENCHADSTGHLPFDEWVLDAHSQTTENERFLTMYLGTDVHGNQSPPTEYTCSPDYGCFPLPPDPDEPYYGPGYKLDFPNSAGNCAACHVPAAAANNPYGVDPTTVSGVGAEGVACDFCHKVWDVSLDPSNGVPYANMPGVLSFELRRPPEGHQYFAGPFDDVAPGEDTYSALQTESQYCAPCHFAVFWDTTVYNSFGEWLSSPYSDPDTGQTCQNCHMPALGVDHFARLDAGGLVRDPAAITSHRMPGAADETLLQNAVTLQANAIRQKGQVDVSVTLINDQTGHHIPTDSPLRHLILLVEAAGPDGDRLAQVSGPKIPEWAGIGDPAEGYYAGLPGKAYAKILEEKWTLVSPSGAYWNPTTVLSDNRIPALGSDETLYTFIAPENEEVNIRITLLFRRAFIELIEQKGWQVPDIIMEDITLVLGE